MPPHAVRKSDGLKIVFAPGKREKFDTCDGALIDISNDLYARFADIVPKKAGTTRPFEEHVTLGSWNAS